MRKEFTAPVSNGTWDIVKHTACVNVVGCKRVFKIKQKPNGTIECYKAQLVEKGFHY